MADNRARRASLRGRAGRAGACCAALAAVAALTASCGTTTATAGTLKTTGQRQVTGGHAASDAAGPLCSGRHASRIRLRRLVVIRHGPIHANAGRRSPGTWTVTSATGMQSVQRALCALPTQPPGVYHCPADFGISYRLVYYGPHGVLPAVTADATGCQLVSGLGNATRWTAKSPGFWRALARAIGVARLDGAAFITP